MLMLFIAALALAHYLNLAVVAIGKESTGTGR